MVKVNCYICNMEFDAQRRSKLCCCKECEKSRKSIYDAERYYIFRNSNRKKRREMLAEKYSIISSNLHKLESICDECLTNFFWDYNIYQSFENTYVSSYNSTECGEPCCPNCGLILEQQVEIQKKSNCIVKNQAIYCARNKIDFLREAEYLRKKRNEISYIGDLTKDEEELCIRSLLNEGLYNKIVR